MILKHLLGYVLALLYYIPWITSDVPVEQALPRPLDLSLTWYNEFCVQLSWNVPEGVDASCELKYIVIYTNNRKSITEKKKRAEFKRCVALMGGVHFSVQSECNKDQSSRSEPAVYTIAAPTELVKDFHCFQNSSVTINCFWTPINNTPGNLQLYYSRIENKTAVSPTLRCSEYLPEVDKTIGCHIKGVDGLAVFLQINGTVNGSPVRNTFEVNLMDNVKPAAPKVNITQEEKKLILTWDSPEHSTPKCWDYWLKYTKCQNTLSKLIKSTDASRQRKQKIPYDSRCQYRVQVKAVLTRYCGSGESDWSHEEKYGEDDWSNLVIAVVIPASVFLISILFLSCLMKHREKLFPQIPQPSLMFKDMLNISKEQKTFISNLYVPVEEDVECNVSLENKLPVPIMQPDS
ncbi:hypothetical protein DPEC_G00103880 [Dallia pectoralis]|uniref:Uncharacterized protein n=1 Tax=Dallia pectoralis TaxID=75939 RepID=A0ACC2GXY7_DALPE|nr:hypothetical protein DPEC_G00103880 [Dallia pectoralis]